MEVGRKRDVTFVSHSTFYSGTLQCSPQRCSQIWTGIIVLNSYYFLALELDKHIFLFYTYLHTYLYRILFLLFVYTVNVVYLLPISPKNIYWNEFCLGRIYADINKQYIRLRNICILVEVRWEKTNIFSSFQNYHFLYKN